MVSEKVRSTCTWGSKTERGAEETRIGGKTIRALFQTPQEQEVGVWPLRPSHVVGVHPPAALYF